MTHYSFIEQQYTKENLAPKGYHWTDEWRKPILGDWFLNKNGDPMLSIGEIYLSPRHIIKSCDCFETAEFCSECGQPYIENDSSWFTYVPDENLDENYYDLICNDCYLPIVVADEPEIETRIDIIFEGEMDLILTMKTLENINTEISKSFFEQTELYKKLYAVDKNMMKDAFRKDIVWGGIA